MSSYIEQEEHPEQVRKNEIPNILPFYGLQGHLRLIFDSLRGVDSSLSQARLKAWLSSTQKVPKANPVKKEFTFEDWLHYIWANSFLEAQEKIVIEDLTRPPTNYYISSSHNTYLCGNQWLSKSLTESYKNVLTRGCRCVEIDVHNGDLRVNSNEPSDQPSRPPSSSSDNKNAHSFASKMSTKATKMFEGMHIQFGKGKDKLRGDKCPPNLSSEENRGRSRGISSSESSQSDVTPGEPIVKHGWTFTAPVGFRAVCRTIGEEAFKASELPLIVSLEVHADLEQQEIMVKIMREEWGEILLDSPISDCDPAKRLPRLEQLKKKIIVKVKKGNQDSDESSSVVKEASKINDSMGSEIERNSIDDTKKNKIKICESLGNLGIYTCSKRFTSFSHSSAEAPSHIYSISESDIIDLHKTQKARIFAHNRNYFIRTYPNPKRIDSSNPDPSIFWQCGIQIVALNWQKLDKSMMLNEGMFSNGHGWVLKPSGYRSDDSEIIYRSKIELNITVLAGYHIPVPPGTMAKDFNPYLKCELHAKGVSDTDNESADSELKQKTPSLRGENPDFGKAGHLMQFRTNGKLIEELSFVRFKVRDSRYGKDNLAAWACIRLDRLNQGYRVIHLFDTNAMSTDGMLFVKIEKKMS
ncbi:hypothetical protein K3495_g3787 [Podosphaera aphanis]|nr:hypothetical protein K3495_g3787 [Podosphaera aphanis]